MTGRDFAKNCLFYCSEIVLDAATPGAVPKERLTRNAKLLKESCESWCVAMYWDPDDLMKEMWRVHKGSQSQGKVLDKGKGRKRA